MGAIERAIQQITEMGNRPRAEEMFAGDRRIAFLTKTYRELQVPADAPYRMHAADAWSPEFYRRQRARSLRLVRQWQLMGLGKKSRSEELAHAARVRRFETMPAKIAVAGLQADVAIAEAGRRSRAAVASLSGAA
jgi:hypothetical protein